ncbi:Sodium/calcium exchanger membrane region [Phytophthora cactorum]|nr:Sodium/calcium exchanger membrane region [Phytophthora cactorum]
MELVALLPLPAACNASPFVANMTLGPLGIDYVHIHYCSFAELPLLSFSLLFLWLGGLFYFLGSTADGYFSPTLASLSDRLRVPHDVAGITFLAFGNGAPDVFSAGINELLGGAMFISTVVVGGVAVASAVKVQRWAFLRDGEDLGETAVAALMFLVMYGIYVGSVVLPACVGRYRAAGDEFRGAKLAGKASLMISAFWHALSPRNKYAKRVKRPEQQEHRYDFITRSEAGMDAESAADGNVVGKALEVKEFEMSSPSELAGLRFSSRVFDDHFDVEEEDTLSSPLIADDECDGDDDERIIPQWQQHLRWRWRLKRSVIRIFSSDKPILIKVLYLPQVVLVFVRDITVPLFDDDGYADVDISGGRYPYRVPLWQALVVVGGCACGVISFFTHRSHAPRSLKSSASLLSLAFVACVCWIYAVANELMALLVAVGYITHASNSLLGLTVLAWGNSVGDFITDVSVARAGFPQMAIAGCFGGPVFNLLLGLGLPMAFAFLSGRSEDLSLDVHAWISLGFLSVSLVASLLVFRYYKYHCPAWYGKVLMVYYFIYSLVNVAVALQVRLT